MKKIVLILVVLLTGLSSYGQSRLPTKIGYVDFALLRDTLPATDTMENEIRLATAQFEKQIYDMQNYIQSKKVELDSVSNLQLKKYLQKDIQQMEQKMQQTYQQAEYIIGQLQQEAVRQLNAQIMQAVNRIAKSQNYTLILDSSSGSIVYGLPQDDLTKAVARLLRVRL
jgi:Skp family chaperone for outer membrane proteins